MTPAPKSEFRNDFAGQIGVMVRNDAGTGYRGISVKPGNHVWLDEDEQVATANAPRRDEDNPFTNGSLTLVTEATRIRNRRPIGFTEEGQPPQREPEQAAPEAEAPEEPQEEPVDPEKAKREAEARKVQEERKAAEESAKAAAQRQHDKPAAAEAAKKTTATAKKAASTEEVGTPAAAG